MSEQEKTLRDRYRSLRRKIRSVSPYIKRKRYTRLVEDIEKMLSKERERRFDLAARFLDLPTAATQAKITALQPIQLAATDELCLYVSHGSKPQLKPFVCDHIDALLNNGIAVVLIINTDLKASTIEIPKALAERMSGCIVRENVGFDFAAWAHGYSLIDADKVHERLYLINDSIMGPINLAHYAAVLKNVRENPADLIGLTANPDPIDHLQSFFLVATKRLLQSDAFRHFIAGVLNLPQKQEVIDCYEIGLTRFLKRRGFECKSIFPAVSSGLFDRNDTISQWKKLIELGFPFVKGEVVKQAADRDDVKLFLPAHYL